MSGLGADIAAALNRLWLYLSDPFVSENTWALRHYPEDPEQW